MLYLLNPRVWIAAAIVAALSFSHFWAYRSGKSVIRAAWEKDKVEQIVSARQLEVQYRAKEQALVAAKNESEAKYVELKKRMERSAAGAQSELVRLRDQLAARDRAAAQDPAALARAVGGTGLERELLGQCATALVGLAAEADRLEALVVGLQSYTKNVCMKAN